jgi:plasmid stabilization system protein ParE
MEVVAGDRCVSWLPWYHDMGLVGCLLSPVANQVSADYLKTEDFARRPLAWLDLISRNPGTGSPRYAHELNLPGLQSWPLMRYPHLVFYVERPDHIDVWRVLHGQRDIPAWMQDTG